MPDYPEWKLSFEQELNHAIKARSMGNEGMARVCARRALGVAIGEYLRRQGYPLRTSSVISRLRFLLSLPGLPDPTRLIVEHFLLHIDLDHRLPEGIDLIDETHLLVKSLGID